MRPLPLCSQRLTKAVPFAQKRQNKTCPCALPRNKGQLDETSRRKSDRTGKGGRRCSETSGWPCPAQEATSFLHSLLSAAKVHSAGTGCLRNRLLGVLLPFFSCLWLCPFFLCFLTDSEQLLRKTNDHRITSEDRPCNKIESWSFTPPCLANKILNLMFSETGKRMPQSQDTS